MLGLRRELVGWNNVEECMKLAAWFFAIYAFKTRLCIVSIGALAFEGTNC
jgi:hypothetical protein